MSRTIIDTNIAPGQAFKNRIQNGQMYIDQRNAGSTITINSGTITNASYCVDRWAGAGQPTDGVFTMRRNASGLTQFPTCLTIQTTTADASIGAAQFYLFSQKVEGYNWRDALYGTASARTATLSFWVKSTLTGTFDVAVRNSATNRNYAMTYTINSAGTWEYKTITFTGDTTGTWVTDNGVGLDILFGLGYGSDYKGTLNTWGTSSILGSNSSTALIGTLNANLNITGVQLELGSNATEFEYRPIETELSMCERYYTKTYSLEVAPGAASAAGTISYRAPTATTTYSFWSQFRKSMRISPTVTILSASGAAGFMRNTSASADVAVTGINAIGMSGWCQVTSGSNSVDGNDYGVHYTAHADM